MTTGARQRPDTRSIGPSDFSREHQLIICCARLNMTERDRDNLRSLAGSSLDWDAIVAETLRQSIVPLVYRHLHAHCAELVPGAILEQLRAHYLHASARSMALAAELREVTLLLEGEGVATLPYKGPVLALQAYGDVALRTFTDLDLIVHEHDFAKARRLLATRGYEPLEELTPSREAAVLKLDHNLPLVRADERVVIELHWRIAPSAVTFPMPMDILWSRASSVSLGGARMRAMSTNDLLLVLSVHGSRHGWSAIEWITGIAELMRREDDVRWDEVMREAEAFRIARCVRLAVALADRLLGAPVPREVAQWVYHDPWLPYLLGRAAARLFAPLDDLSPAGQWALFKFEIAVKDGLKERLRDGWCRLFLPTSKDWSAAGLPDQLFAAYYLLRPFRLLGRYLRSARPAPRG